jgi:hypothetical protein
MNIPEKSNPPEPKSEEKIAEISSLPRARIRFGLYALIGGFLIFLLGCAPQFFGLDRSPVVGFIQIAVMLVGIGIICVAGYMIIHSLWRRTATPIAADIGWRLVSTGYVITFFSGMADVFGIGSQPPPNVPFFGVWQARGMEIGLGIIAIGFVMTFPYRKPRV